MELNDKISSSDRLALRRKRRRRSRSFHADKPPVDFLPVPVLQADMQQDQSEHSTTTYIDTIRSDHLAILRNLMSEYSILEQYVGSIFQLKLVIDTNVVIGDLLWMARRKNETDKTAIIEIVHAGTLVIYAPVHLKNEVEEHLPGIAKKSKVPLNKLQIEWASYQKYLKFVDIDESQLEQYKDSVDPDDAPFVILSKMLSLPGVISKDSDIEKIGGKRIDVDIRLLLRNYSRSAAVAFSIRIGGIIAPVAVAIVVISLMKEIVKLLSKMPKNMIVLIICVVAFILIYPKTRKILLDQLDNIKIIIGENWEKLEPIIVELTKIANEKFIDADMNINKIKSEYVQNV